MNNDASFDIIQESNPVQTVAQPKEDNEMLRATDRITALYCRLSVDGYILCNYSARPRPRGASPGPNIIFSLPQ